MLLLHTCFADPWKTETNVSWVDVQAQGSGVPDLVLFAVPAESVWYRTQQMGSDTLSAPARAWNEHADRAFDVDAMKDGVKAKEAVKLQHVDASGLSVYANNQEVTNMGDLVANLPGEGEADRCVLMSSHSASQCLTPFTTLH